MSEIRFGNKIMTVPIVQGGMGVGISLSRLAGAVALNGGMGTIAGVNPGYLDENFHKDPISANIKAIKREIKEAKKIANYHGLVGVNFMYAINNYEKYVKAAVKAGSDFIVSGAGLPLTLPEYVDEKTLIGPIVSSKRALELIIKKWTKKYNRLCDFIVVEGPKAGGHLGFKSQDLCKIKLEDILVEIVAYVKEVEEIFKKKIYIFAAGGIRTRKNMLDLMTLGASGIQLGTPFIATRECDADEGFKRQILNSKNENLKIIMSPAGFPGRAINNDFLKLAEENNIEKGICHKCLKTCNPKECKYCLAESLAASTSGESGLVFSGEDINEINEITDVKSLIASFMEEK